MSGWSEEVRSNGFAAVASAGGLTVHERDMAQCPGCGAEQRGYSRPDPRGPVGLTRDGEGWRCFRCDVGGDAVALAAFLATGEAEPHGRWAEVRTWCASHYLCDVSACAQVPSRVVLGTLAHSIPQPHVARVESPPQRPADDQLGLPTSSAPGGAPPGPTAFGTRHGPRRPPQGRRHQVSTNRSDQH